MSSKTLSDVYKQTKGNRPFVKAEATIEVKRKKDLASRRTEEEVLRHFDLSLEFGPCAGISRMERWERAERHGLNPPGHVRDIIANHRDDQSYTQSLWRDYHI